MNDPLTITLNQAVHALDQSAAEHRDIGEWNKMEADKELAESLSRTGQRMSKMMKRIERRIKRNEDREKQGLPPLTIREQVELDDKEGEVE